jgi:hypothetical protein
MIGENGREMKSFGVFNTRPVNQLSSGRALGQLFALFCILTFGLASQQTFAASLKERGCFVGALVWVVALALED